MQPIRQPANQPTNQPTKQPTNQTTNQSPNQTTNQPNNQPIKQRTNQTTNQSSSPQLHTTNGSCKCWNYNTTEFIDRTGGGTELFAHCHMAHCHAAFVTPATTVAVGHKGWLQWLRLRRAADAVRSPSRARHAFPRLAQPVVVHSDLDFCALGHGWSTRPKHKADYALYVP